MHNHRCVAAPAKCAQQGVSFVAETAHDTVELSGAEAEKIAIRLGHPVFAFNCQQHHCRFALIKGAVGIQNFLAEKPEAALVDVDSEAARETSCDQMVVQEFARERRQKRDANWLQQRIALDVSFERVAQGTSGAQRRRRQQQRARSLTCARRIPLLEMRGDLGPKEGFGIRRRTFPVRGSCHNSRYLDWLAPPLPR